MKLSPPIIPSMYVPENERYMIGIKAYRQEVQNSTLKTSTTLHRKQYTHFQISHLPTPTPLRPQTMTLPWHNRPNMHQPTQQARLLPLPHSHTPLPLSVPPLPARLATRLRIDSNPRGNPMTAHRTYTIPPRPQTRRRSGIFLLLMHRLARKQDSAIQLVGQTTMSPTDLHRYDDEFRQRLELPTQTCVNSRVTK